MWKSSDFLDSCNRILEVANKCKNIPELKQVTLAPLVSAPLVATRFCQSIHGPVQPV